jgi:photosystem II stability/assembly factor-like uncharacterized protein
MKENYIFLVMMFAVTFANAQWVQQNSGTTKNLNSVYFTGINNGVAVGDSGTILTTTDGGINWISRNSGTTNTLRSVHFPNANVGYAVGDGGITLKTINGGIDWTIIPSVSFRLYSTFFTDSQTGYAAGDSGIIKTTDGGINWVFHNTSYFLSSVFFPTKDTGYAIGGEFIKTTDGGLSWTNPNNTEGNSTFFTGANTGFTVGAFCVIKKTTDGGMNWINQSYGGDFCGYFSVCFTDDSTGYVVGGDWGIGGSIEKTTDGGIHWTGQISTTYYFLFSVCFPSSDTGYIVGMNGAIQKTTNGGAGAEEIEMQGSEIIFYPNPANDNLSIEVLQDSEIEMLNIHGQLVKKFKVKDKKICMDLSDFSSGVYIVKAMTDKGTAIKKLIKQ